MRERERRGGGVELSITVVGATLVYRLFASNKENALGGLGGVSGGAGVGGGGDVRAAADQMSEGPLVRGGDGTNRILCTLGRQL